jgi:hypothetical protein
MDRVKGKVANIMGSGSGIGLTLPVKVVSGYSQRRRLWSAQKKA